MAQRVENPKSEQVITVLTKTDKERLAALCSAWGMNVSEAVRQIIRDRLTIEDVGLGPRFAQAAYVDSAGLEYDATLVPDTKEK